MSRLRMLLRKSVAMTVIACLLLVSFAGCGGDDEEIVVITERFFFNQMTHITMNLNEYEGRTIQLEGLFRKFSLPARDAYIVMRYALCCEYKPIWFELDLNSFEPPEDDAWVEVVGILELRDRVPMLLVTSLTELEERGQAVV